MCCGSLLQSLPVIKFGSYDQMKVRRTLKKKRNRNGAATVEFAVVLPLLLLIIFGIIEFGHAFLTQYTISGAAYEGARTAVLPGSTNTLVTTKVANVLSGAGLTYSSCITNPVNVTSAKAGDPVSVTVTVIYNPLSGLIPGLNGKSLRGVAVMRKEGFGN